MPPTPLTAACPSCGYGLVDAITIPISPVPALIRSFVTPTSSEAKLIRSTLPQVLLDISEVDREIDRVQAILDTLKRKREGLRKYTDLHESLLAPVRRLPPELLAEVYMHLLPPRQGSFSFVYQKQYIIPPSQVCRHWRDVALSTPRLWSSVLLILLRDKIRPRIELARLWLSRTGNYPLSIRFDCTPFNLDVPESIRLMIDTVLPYCHLWQYMTIYIPWWAISSLTAARGNLPCLETLAIYVWGPRESFPVNTFEFAPRLHTLDLNLDSGINLRDLHLPWTQITHLRCNVNNLIECHAMLTLVPHIVSVEVYFTARETHSSISYSTIQRSQLTKLKLVPCRSDPGPLLHCLSLPMLRDFEYGSADEHFWNQEQFISLLSRSRCSLQRLSLRQHELDEDTLIQVLEHTPKLKELSLGPTSNRMLSINVLSRLTYRQTTPCLVPMLRHLEIYQEDGFDSRSFVDMLESRWRLGDNAAGSGNAPQLAITRIQTVELRWIDQFDQQSLVRCRQLVTEGLDLQLMVEDDDLLDSDVWEETSTTSV